MEIETTLLTATYFLNAIYEHDENKMAIDEIAKAYVKAKLGNEEGVDTLLSALYAVRDFTDDLINNLKQINYDNKTTDRWGVHNPR